MSWLKFSESLGAYVERAVLGTIQGARAWQDRRVGRRAEEARSAVVVEARKIKDTQEPLLITPPVIQIPQSTRAVKEKQAALFQDMPDSDLPPLALLDEAESHGETVSAET